MLKNFITFEGIDGCGKSTQIKLLSNYLNQSGVSHIITREPGGTVLGEKLRSVMLDYDELTDPVIEYLLLTAGRKHHLDNVILPALNSGKIVLCDRFVDSTLIYQCYLKGMDVWMFERLNDMLLGEVVPNLTFYLDISPETALSRMTNRVGNGNVYDKKGLDFQCKLRNSYLEIASKYSERIVTVDTNGNIDDVHSMVRELFTKSIIGFIDGTQE